MSPGEAVRSRLLTVAVLMVAINDGCGLTPLAPCLTTDSVGKGQLRIGTTAYRWYPLMLFMA